MNATCKKYKEVFKQVSTSEQHTDETRRSIHVVSHKPFILRHVSLFTTIATSSGSQVVKNFVLGLF